MYVCIGHGLNDFFGDGWFSGVRGGGGGGKWIEPHKVVPDIYWYAESVD